MVEGTRESLLSCAGGLAEDLARQGYTARSIGQHVRLLGHLERWLDREGLTAADLTVGEVGRFVDARRAEDWKCWRSRRGLAPLIGYLRRAGVVPAPAEPVLATPTERLLGGYRRHLVTERALLATTADDYERYARLFLSALAEPVRADLARLSAAQVTIGVRAECARHSAHWARNFTTALRSLLRFLYLDGHLSADLSPSVLAVPARHGSGLPRALDPRDVAALLATCSPELRSGRRDVAILTLVARLGLRAAEVAALELGDIDWRAGEVVVRGKGGRRDRLPLPADVGEVIVDYLRHGRPMTSSRCVFILAVAPRAGVTASTIDGVVRRACQRAGIAPCGPHRLRHTAATEMLRAGASLAEVGQVLRHRQAATTAIYAKVDIGALSALAMAWPEVSA